MGNQTKTPGAMVLVPVDSLTAFMAEYHAQVWAAAENEDELRIAYDEAGRELAKRFLSELTVQPPAVGGEPEVLGKVKAFGPYLIEIDWKGGEEPKPGTDLIDRAHVAPLLAEIEKNKRRIEFLESQVKHKDLGIDSRIADISTLESRIAQLEAAQRLRRRLG